MVAKWRDYWGVIVLGVVLTVFVVPPLLVAADVYIELQACSDDKEEETRLVQRRLRITHRLALVCRYAAPTYPRIAKWIAKDQSGRFAVAFGWLQRLFDFTSIHIPSVSQSGSVETCRLILQAHGVS